MSKRRIFLDSTEYPTRAGNWEKCCLPSCTRRQPRNRIASQGGHPVIKRSRTPGLLSPLLAAVAALALALCLGACGSSSSSSSTNASDSGGVTASSPTVTVLMGTAPDSLDPAVGASTQSAEATWLAYTGLVTYAHASGQAGTQLIPGLA